MNVYMTALLENEFGSIDPWEIHTRLQQTLRYGAWVDIQDNQITFGCIIEDTDAQIEPRRLVWPFTRDELWNVIEEVDVAAKELEESM